MNTQTTKLFKSRAGERSHIWLEGKKLVDHGFFGHLPYSRLWYRDRLVLVAKGHPLSSEGVTLMQEAKVVMTQRQNAAIRIESKRVQDMFGNFSDVKVTFEPGRITIEGGTPLYARSIPEGVSTQNQRLPEAA